MMISNLDAFTESPMDIIGSFFAEPELEDPSKAMEEPSRSMEITKPSKVEGTSEPEDPSKAMEDPAEENTDAEADNTPTEDAASEDPAASADANGEGETNIEMDGVPDATEGSPDASGQGEDTTTPTEDTAIKPEDASYFLTVYRSLRNKLNIIEKQIKLTDMYISDAGDVDTKADFRSIQRYLFVLKGNVEMLLSFKFSSEEKDTIQKAFKIIEKKFELLVKEIERVAAQQNKLKNS